MAKKVKKQSETNFSENSTSEKSEEFVNFENAVRAMFSLSPEESKKIREKYPSNKKRRRGK